MSLPRAYLRIDPNMDSHPDQDAMLTLILFGNRCSERGRFRSLSTLEKILGKKRLKACLDRKDLIPISGGRFYVSGWDEWQEGDLTVGERMGRIRKRRSMDSQDLPENDRNEAVTPPLPERITGRNSPSEALTLTLGDDEITDSVDTQAVNAGIDRLDEEIAFEEKRFTSLALPIRDTIQQVLDSLPRSPSRSPFSASHWLRTGLTGISRKESALTVLRLTNDALEARRRAQATPYMSDKTKATFDTIDRVLGTGAYSGLAALPGGKR